MSEMKTPTITIDNKTYKAKARGKVWRKLLQLKNSIHEQDSEEGLNEMYEFYVICFNDPAVTLESIEEHIELDQVYGLFAELGQWTTRKITGKMAEIPNKETPMEE
ncbi:hypothetical protein SAMN05446037_100264 [Anaerovirgula multivorans]|uniref:Phage tail assembly chaperone protein, TAC n=1 Tax=Anaerovirgula multivorans TaxID=312168 RepID=A0A239AK65_9FIRM|nr:hypothetical protein [Anaerovirgula multivorans]SNR95444.1 hypothetical protein SAMN05446037_100264 [Anaerovirgula multivorans]